MKPLPTSRRLLDALALQRSPVVNRSVEPVLWLDTLPPSQQHPPSPPSQATPLGRRAVELALEEGSLRTYVPMEEAVVIERRGR